MGTPENISKLEVLCCWEFSSPGELQELPGRRSSWEQQEKSKSEAMRQGTEIGGQAPPTSP